MNRRNFLKTAGATVGISPLIQAAVGPGEFDLTGCTIVTAEGASARERKAATVLAEEVLKRSLLKWPVQGKAPSGSGAAIYLATNASARKLGSRMNASMKAGERLSADGFSIASGSDGSGRWISIVGADERGLLFGVGKLLRTTTFGKQTAAVDPTLLHGATAPKYPLRGHQLGYRPKTNSYDAWDVATWDQYIRDLAMFGTNAIELMPPRTDDEPDSPHFPLPPIQMMIEMSRICDEYGLDVWIWYPAMDPDYANPATVESALKEWARHLSSAATNRCALRSWRRSGHTEPKALLAFLEKQKRVCSRYHPKAQMWMSPQGFNEAWMDDFFRPRERQQAGYLAGRTRVRSADRD